MTIGTYPVEIRKLLEALEQQKRDIINLLPALHVAHEIKTQFRQFDLKIDVSDFFPEVMIAIYNIKDLKDIAPVLRYLANRGYRQKENSRVDVPTSNYLWYQLGKIRLVIWLSTTEEAACKFVVTGEKKVPVYKLQCD